MSKKYLGFIGVFALLAVFAVAFPAHAEMRPHPVIGIGMRMAPKNIVFGSVTALNGNIITVNIKRATTTTTYSVDATNAVVIKNRATTTVSAILVGDTIVAQGTVTGTSVVAAHIFDGKMMPMPFPGKMDDHHATGIFQKIGNFFKGFFHK